MAVNLDNSVIRQFELAGITKEDIGKTIERDRAAGLSDKDIELNAQAKAFQLEKANPSLSYGRGFTRAVSNLPFGDTINRVIQGAGAAYEAGLDYITGNNQPTVRQYLEAPEGTTPSDRSFSDMFKENYDKRMKKIERTFQEQNYDVPKAVRYPLDIAGTIGSYGLLPEGIYATVPRAAAFGAADAYQSGINKNTSDRIVNALIGGIATGATTGIVNKATSNSALKTAEKEYPLLTEGLREAKPKTTQDALDIVVQNYTKYSNPASGLSGRASDEMTKLFSNLPEKEIKNIFDSVEKPYESKISKSIVKALEKTNKTSLKDGLKPETVDAVARNLEQLSKLNKTSKAVNTEGLAGALTGGLTGGALLGPWGAVGGALLGSKGKVLPMVGDIVQSTRNKMNASVAKAVVNPKNVSKLTKALTGLTKKASVPVAEEVIKGKNKEYNVKPSNKNLVPVNNNSTTIIIPNNEDSSITEKHLKLLAALYPEFYNKVA